ncbi:alpha-D-ribose 1-methylphosphonate 5-triphosphate diphosphatase [Geminicoccaceae bacterium 1502E]|nr:alpha-D-ribose 1-methylphosphonate 5-triphosphate diphosphatase [Geminicoccaceae bacterium 1502E]
MSEAHILANARIVTREAVVDGSVVLREGVIAALERGGTAPAGATNLGGDLLIPGLVELHTDNLEKHFSPRVGVEWDPVAASISHDVQLAGSGITTVFDSLVIGAAPGWDMRDSWLRPMLGGLAHARSHGMLKIDHRLHLRCEVTHPEIGALFESYADEPGLGVMSLMDHAPGDRQSPDIEAYKQRYRSSIGMSHEQVEAHVNALIEGSQRHGPGNRRLLGDHARRRGIALASHDDARLEHVEEAAALGCVVSEFPTTMEAAEAARAHGLQVLMGAPNLIRGGSHSGNVAAGDLARAGLLDIISSDYIPASLIMAAFRLAAEPFGMALPEAVATVTDNPARAAGLDDRGRIEVGLRGDLVRVRLVDGRPVVRGVWVQGERVA